MGIRDRVRECLARSDCMVVVRLGFCLLSLLLCPCDPEDAHGPMVSQHGQNAKDCAKPTSEGVDTKCRNLIFTLFECKRGQVGRSVITLAIPSICFFHFGSIPKIQPAPPALTVGQSNKISGEQGILILR